MNQFNKKFMKSWQLYLMFLLPLLYMVIFKYIPMYGSQIAFKNFRPALGITGSPWVGMKHFSRFIHSTVFFRLLGNTMGISIYQLLAGFPFPIILALSLNCLRRERYKKTVQMVTYAPHFISTVVMVGIILQILAPRTGLLNQCITFLGGSPVNLMGRPELFKSIYVWTGVWQSAGYGSIIYIAALSSVPPELHEAAVVDGASRFQRVCHIDLPSIIPTAIIILIMNTGHILDVGFEKVLLLQNPLNMRTSEIISTYVYRVGLASETTSYSYPAAIGLFKSAVGLIIIVAVNRIAKKVGDTSLW